MIKEYKLVVLDFSTSSVNIHTFKAEEATEDIVEGLLDMYGYKSTQIQYMVTSDLHINVL